MPSFQWFKPFSKKNKGHVNKYHNHDYNHDYHNMRAHQAGAQFTATPPMMGQQQSHFHTNNNNNNNQHFTNQYHQPPPHSLSHRQHQLNQQQLFMQSLPPPNQQHQQLLPQIQQSQQQQQQILQPATINQHHQQAVQAPIMAAPSLASITPGLVQNQNHNQTLQQQQILQHQPHNHQHHQHQQQAHPCHQCGPFQQSMAHIIPLQTAPTTNNIQHTQIVNQAQLPTTATSYAQMPIIGAQQHSSIQPVQQAGMHPLQQQQQQQQCHLQQQPTTFQYNNNYVNTQTTPNYSNVTTQVPMSPPQVVASPPQCTCQSCPYQQQLQQQQQQQQQQLVSSQHQSIQQQQTDQIQYTLGSCQFRHQASSADIQSNGNTMHTQHTTASTTSIPSNHLCPSHMSSQQGQHSTLPMMMNSSTPGLQLHQSPTMIQQQQLQQQQPLQTNMGTNMQQQQQQYQQQQYHTIQPNMYQQQKQQQQQLQQHHRGHSQLAQAMSTAQHHESLTQQHVIYQERLAPQSFAQHQHQQQQQQQEQQRRDEEEEEAKLQDFSRYANVQICMNGGGPSLASKISSDFSQSAKFQEHVYCNQKPQRGVLPPYELPPSYEHFIENKRMYAIDVNGQHTTHLSESMLQRTKDFSYENLRARGHTYQEALTS